MRTLRKWLSSKKLASPTVREKELIAEIKEKFGQFSLLRTDNCLPSEKEWYENINFLRALVLSEDPRGFLSWDVIKSTMQVKNASYIKHELKYLKTLSAWSGRWRHAVDEKVTGHRLPKWLCPDSSENLIHHAYHLARFEEKTSLLATDMNYIIDFGGGYGRMCRLFFNLGFKGKYIIYDFPAFSALQQFFLKSIDIKVNPIETLGNRVNGVFCISDIEHLKAILSAIEPQDKSMLIATWSISETTVEFRNLILPMLSPLQYFLIGYQNQFGEVNNADYFEGWKESLQDIEWHKWEIEHLKRNFYLVGKRKNTDFMSRPQRFELPKR